MTGALKLCLTLSNVCFFDNGSYSLVISWIPLNQWYILAINSRLHLLMGKKLLKYLQVCSFCFGISLETCWKPSVSSDWIYRKMLALVCDLSPWSNIKQCFIKLLTGGVIRGTVLKELGDTQQLYKRVFWMTCQYCWCLIGKCSYLRK